jgi:hypothetical protein
MVDDRCALCQHEADDHAMGACGYCDCVAYEAPENTTPPVRTEGAVNEERGRPMRKQEDTAC